MTEILYHMLAGLGLFLGWFWLWWAGASVLAAVVAWRWPTLTLGRRDARTDLH